MSKYIRTKDGRILEWEKLNEITKLSIDTCEETIEQADTIEELCDEIIGINNGEIQRLRTIPYACYQYWNGGVYGAIWTDIGLIYVAKMNKKGELKLI